MDGVLSVITYTLKLFFKGVSDTGGVCLEMLMPCRSLEVYVYVADPARILMPVCTECGCKSLLSEIGIQMGL